MSHEHNDDKLEAYLRQFSLRQPRPLPQRYAIRRRFPVPALAAVAALIVTALLLLFFQQAKHPHRPQITRTQPADLAVESSLASFNRILRQDPEKLDGAMNSLSPRLLPDVQRSRGILKTLARE
ncbi:MAG TPA: hypothetical protein VJN64_15255 [Terriglobales bacterium]|nr:hypothetical protein [Terriglobales bacterium]